YGGSDAGAMIKVRKEAVAQGMNDGSITWVCTLSCYAPEFIEEGGDAVEGTYVWLFFLPFEEADTNAELASFMDYIGTDFPAAWAAGAWADGVLFEQSVNAIVERDGPNALTRRALIDEVHATTDFDVNGWWGTVNFETTLDISPCFVMLQVENGEYVRRYPAERGTLDCDPGNVVVVSADPEAFSVDN
ncbi:MAG: ABC transporter substrate-binding protein, partial [Actinobacteria bacterium]|nr:ABC transporter substrate-binding protein [Actinomycetota bacterium]NIS32673.1 ABC transporter substrate-binding protein [Actinomycetota bacterium]NIT96397.1 ABC transporter substrate-binding protein [Actinomycetota bacterium]NIU20100.1 ABC transporter substrate-binding protein [Actinomycetota bacterium]NIU67675.1 ABC transporter substrate-binding protein [Actinomycetota bacterium]